MYGGQCPPYCSHSLIGAGYFCLSGKVGSLVGEKVGFTESCRKVWKLELKLGLISIFIYSRHCKTMNAEAVLAWLDTFVPAHTGETLSELERIILQQVWLGRKYLEIANQYGCTEGHARICWFAVVEVAIESAQAENY